MSFPAVRLDTIAATDASGIWPGKVVTKISEVGRISLGSHPMQQQTAWALLEATVLRIRAAGPLRPAAAGRSLPG